MSASYITADMKSILGAVVDRRVSHPVAQSDIRRWFIAIHYPESPPTDCLADDAMATEDFNPFAWHVAEKMAPKIVHGPRDPDKYEKSAGVAGPGLKFQIAGGFDVEYGVGVRAGDVITSVTTMQDYRERTGRLGLMLFTVVRDKWTNQVGETVKIAYETAIRYGR